MCHPIPVARALQQAIPNHCTAKTLGPGERLTLGVQALAGNQTITGLAEEAGVSRKFVYQQADIAQAALDDAFASADADGKVLFHLPITKDWLRQAALGLLLICHSSYRGVHEFFRDLLNVHMAPSTVHNIVHDAIDKARLHNLSQDLAKVDIASLDEIFQNGQPVLVGADSRSTYCFLLRITEITTSRFLGPVVRALARSWRNHGLKPALRNREVIFRELLSAEDQRDADTWALRLLECQDHGFAPTATIADFGTGIRAGQERAQLGVPCRGDVFHALHEITPVVTFLENRAYDTITAHDKLERKKTKLQQQGRRDQQGQRAALTRKLAAVAAEQAKAITLADDVAVLARWLRTDVFAVSGLPLCRPERNGPATAHATPPLFASGVVRASSIIENLSSRLRNYFFLRREIGAGYLELLQFFLNHRRFLRSEHAERVDKSPAELLTGQSHPHWLEMLGERRSCQN